MASKDKGGRSTKTAAAKSPKEKRQKSVRRRGTRKRARAGLGPSFRGTSAQRVAGRLTDAEAAR